MPVGRRSAKRTGRSPGTLGKVAKAEQQQKRRAAQRDRKWLKLEDGDEAVLRSFPTEEFFKDGFVHRVPLEGKGGKTFYPDIMCLDQDDDGTPCPGCKDELQRRYKFWLPVIVRDYQDDADSKAADTVVIWSGGITVAKMLNKLSAKHDLAKRDIVVARSGSTKDDTEYDLDWEDEEDIPYSAKDKKLLENAPDLTRYTKIPEFDDFYKPFGGEDDDDDNPAETARKPSPFSKKAAKKRSEEESNGGNPLVKSAANKPIRRKRRV